MLTIQAKDFHPLFSRGPVSSLNLLYQWKKCWPDGSLLSGWLCIGFVAAGFGTLHLTFTKSPQIFFPEIKCLKLLLTKRPRLSFDSSAPTPVYTWPGIDSSLITISKLLNRSLTWSSLAAVPRHRHTSWIGWNLVVYVFWKPLWPLVLSFDGNAASKRFMSTCAIFMRPVLFFDVINAAHSQHSDPLHPPLDH